MKQLTTIRTNLITESLVATEKSDHLEVTPAKYKKPKYAGTAIEARGNHEVYGDGGHAGVDHEIRQHLKDPKKNTAFKSADSYSKQHLGKGYKMDDKQPTSSLKKQYAIGKTYELAADHPHEYKKAVFNDYQEHRPDIVKHLKAHDYDSLVKHSYEHVAKETTQQFHHLPVKTQYHEGHMGYHNSGEMLRDVHAHNNLTVYRGGDKHEFLHHVDKKTGLNENEQFRAVHDYYGHGVHGNQFGAKGEEVAWHAHHKMFSKGAHVAMTSETRGQNSYVNYTHANLDTQKTMEEHRAKRREALNAGDTGAAAEHADHVRKAGEKWNYAKQASVALPSSMLHPHYDGSVPKHIAHLLHDPAAKNNPTYDVKKDHLGLVPLAQHHNTTSHASLTGGGQLNKKNAHSDLQHIASVHGFTSISHNPFA